MEMLDKIKIKTCQISHHLCLVINKERPVFLSLPPCSNCTINSQPWLRNWECFGDKMCPWIHSGEIPSTQLVFRRHLLHTWHSAGQWRYYGDKGLSVQELNRYVGSQRDGEGKRWTTSSWSCSPREILSLLSSLGVSACEMGVITRPVRRKRGNILRKGLAVLCASSLFTPFHICLGAHEQNSTINTDANSI